MSKLLSSPLATATLSRSPQLASRWRTGLGKLSNQTWLGLVPVIAYLGLFYLVPLVYLLLASFRTTTGVGLEFAPDWTLAHYQEFFTQASNWIAYRRSLTIAGCTVLFSILCAYPLAYTITFIVPQRYRQLLLLLIIAPFWTSFIIRAFAWQLLLSQGGLLNSGLAWLHLPRLTILNTHVATTLGFTLFGTLLITLSLCSVMSAIPANLLAAAANLGAKQGQTFYHVILPLTLPGMVTGALLTFIITLGDYVVPTLLGGGVRTVLAQMMVGAMTTHFNVPRAATYAMVILVTILAVAIPLLHWAGRNPMREEAL
ncbi:MAG: ABC transporter permease [Cyanobacteria bacterium P01_F01_bin.86]